MSPKPSAEPLRGEAAWKAERERIAKKNDATCAQGRRDRDARDAELAKRQREAERLDRATWDSSSRPSAR
jgi:hypothetical protein